MGSCNHAMNSIVEIMQFRVLVSWHGGSGGIMQSCHELNIVEIMQFRLLVSWYVGSGGILQSCHELNCGNNAVQVVSVMAWWQRWDLAIML